MTRDPFTDPRSFQGFKRGAAVLHEAGKIGDARRKLLGSKIADPEIRAAIAQLDAWLVRQPDRVREYALAKPAPRVIRV